jgi:DNA-binding response OmpR family regulator
MLQTTIDRTNILIVEDHAAVRLVLGMAFKKQYQVVTKSDGLAAMAWLSAGNFPDIIMLDLQMPRLNGISFLRQLRASGTHSDTPVLLISANEDENLNAEVFDLGVVDFIRKPFDPFKLNEKVKNVLNRKYRVAMD